MERRRKRERQREDFNLLVHCPNSLTWKSIESCFCSLASIKQVNLCKTGRIFLLKNLSTVSIEMLEICTLFLPNTILCIFYILKYSWTYRFIDKKCTTVPGCQHLLPKPCFFFFIISYVVYLNKHERTPAWKSINIGKVLVFLIRSWRSISF